MPVLPDGQYWETEYVYRHFNSPVRLKLHNSAGECLGSTRVGNSDRGTAHDNITTWALLAEAVRLLDYLKAKQKREERRERNLIPIGKFPPNTLNKEQK